MIVGQGPSSLSLCSVQSQVVELVLSAGWDGWTDGIPVYLLGCVSFLLTDPCPISSTVTTPLFWGRVLVD